MPHPGGGRQMQEMSGDEVEVEADRAAFLQQFRSVKAYSFLYKEVFSGLRYEIRRGGLVI